MIITLDLTNDDPSQLDTPITQQSNSSSTDSFDTAEVRLDIKKFAQLLHSQQPYAEKMVFSMPKSFIFLYMSFILFCLDFCNNNMLHICIVAEYFTLQCILPSIQL